MSDDKPDNELVEAAPADPPASPPPPEYEWERDCRGHLTPASRPLVAAEILRLYRGGEIRSITLLAQRLGLSMPTIRTFMESLGLIGGAGNQNKPGGVTIRSRAVETPAQRKKRKAEERDRKKAAVEAMKIQQAQVREARRAAAPAATPAPDPVADPRPDPVPDPPPGPRHEPASKQRPKGRVDPNTPDLLAAFAVPATFDVLDRVRKIAAAPWVDVGKQLQALEILLKQSGAKGRIDWASMTIEQIPDDVRPRLAGMLVGWLEWAELPEVVRGAPAPCRQVYRLCGVLPTKAEDAEVVLARWEALRAELRELAGEVRVDLRPVAAPLELDLAAETAYVQPQWEIDSTGN